jgi:hypothetical protein
VSDVLTIDDLPEPAHGHPWPRHGRFLFIGHEVYAWLLEHAVPDYARSYQPGYDTGRAWLNSGSIGTLTGLPVILAKPEDEWPQDRWAYIEDGLVKSWGQGQYAIGPGPQEA